MNEHEIKKFDEGKDPIVTAVSLIVIFVQSLLIIFGYLYRWDWLAYECAAILFVSSIWVVGYGIKAIIEANKMMANESTENESAGENNHE